VKEAVEAVKIQAKAGSFRPAEWLVPNGQVFEAAEGESWACHSAVVAMEEEVRVSPSPCGRDVELCQVWTNRSHHHGVNRLANLSLILLRLSCVEAEPLLQSGDVGWEPFEVGTAQAQSREPIVSEVQRPHQTCKAWGREEGSMKS
jgi:hypothetical protein